MNLVEALEAGRQDFLEAVANLTEDAAATKPSPERWSVLECIEHVVMAERRFLVWLQRGATITAAPNPENEARLFSTVTDRTFKVTAPEAVVPSGHFHTLGDALAAFNTARDRSVRIARNRGETLYGIGATHPRFGEMNGVEVVHMIAGHARRHAMQIRETRAALGQPVSGTLT